MTTNEHEPDTELTPTAQAPEVAEAWSLDDTADEHPADNEQQPRRHGLAVSLGLVALVVGIIGCVILLAGVFFTWHRANHTEPVHVPAPTSAPVAAAPSAPVSTVTENKDAAYVALLREHGYTQKTPTPIRLVTLTGPAGNANKADLKSTLPASF
jgi:hypothetical protein